MTLVLDENLSPRLVERLASLFAGVTHVRDVGLKQASDDQIWKWARDNGYAVVTADSDFVQLSQLLGWPPKVIYIEKCSFPFRVIEDLLRQNALRISEFDKDSRRGLLVLR